MELLMFLIVLTCGFVFTLVSFKYPVFGVFAIVFNLFVVGFLVSDGVTYVVGLNLGEPVLVSYDVTFPILMVSFIMILNVLVLLHKWRY